MKTIIFSVAVFAFLLFNAAAQQNDYSQLRASAEAQYSQKSYSRAHEIYASVDKSKLNATELRWVEFRLADTSWRAQAATSTSDNTIFEKARKELEEVIRVADKDVDRDLVWAEAHESLGDLFWGSGRELNWGSAWPHYQQALDWWAGQRDLDRARTRYLAIVFKAADPAVKNEYYFYTSYGNYIPIDVLQNALKISTSANERSHLNFLVAMTMRNTRSDLESIQRIGDHFEDALKAGKQSDWYDDALFHYAEWMNTSGNVREVAEGQWQHEPNHVKALELYRRLTTEFRAGETRYYDQAKRQILEITSPQLDVRTFNIFLPDSEIQFTLNARNIKRVDFALYKFDMTRDIPYAGSVERDEGVGEPVGWMGKMSTFERQPVKTWTTSINITDHRTYAENERIQGRLPVGAYLLEAKGDSGPMSARELILVSDATLVLKSSGKQALVFFSNALTGAPIANANITLWESYYYDNLWRWRRLRQTTNEEGLSQFSLLNAAGQRNLFVTAASNDRQAFAVGQGYRSDDSANWRIYAFTDRPAYRPKETLQWKFIARRSVGSVYSTPANEIVEYQINDSRGTKVTEGKATLNSFGSAWGSLELSENLPLGHYEIQFWDQGRTRHIGSAMLFRLEEYKLPNSKSR